MTVKAKYRTQQREELLDYLASVKGRHVTAQDVCLHLQSQGAKIGTTTVYRQLERMVDEGLVGKYIIDATSPACFEYIGHEAHGSERTCFHCKCDVCGTLIHMHCDELAQIGAHLKKDHGFALNAMRTVFYGTCAACASA